MARYGLFGRSGSGKSWFFGYLLEDLVPEFEYAIHFDIEDEEQGLSVKDDPLFATFYVDEEFATSEVEYQDRRMGLVEAVVLENKTVRIVPDGLTPAEQRELFARLSKLSMELGKTDANVHLSADEAHQVVPSESHMDGELDERVVRMLTGGRKKGVEWALCTQRPSNLHKEAFSQMNYGIYFSLVKDVDVAKVNGSTGFNAYDHLPELAPREFLLEDLDSGELSKRSSEELERDRPHLAADDGVADEKLDRVAEGGETIEAVDS